MTFRGPGRPDAWPRHRCACGPIGLTSSCWIWACPTAWGCRPSSGSTPRSRAPRRVIVLSIVSDEELAVQAVQLGAQDYLIKGLVDSSTLVRSVRYGMERQRAEEALREARAAAGGPGARADRGAGRGRRDAERRDRRAQAGRGRPAREPAAAARDRRQLGRGHLRQGRRRALPDGQPPVRGAVPRQQPARPRHDRRRAVPRGSGEAVPGPRQAGARGRPGPAVGGGRAPGGRPPHLRRGEVPAARRAGAGLRHLRHRHRHQRAQAPRGAAHAVAEAREHRPAGGRRGARLQQHADRHPRLLRAHRCARLPADDPPRRRHRRRSARRGRAGGRASPGSCSPSAGAAWSSRGCSTSTTSSAETCAACCAG